MPKGNEKTKSEKPKRNKEECKTCGKKLHMMERHAGDRAGVCDQCKNREDEEKEERRRRALAKKAQRFGRGNR